MKKRKEEEFDEDHALDMAMNKMLEDFSEEDIQEIINANEAELEPNEKLKQAAEDHKKSK